MKAAWKLPTAAPSPRGETRHSAILSASMPMRRVFDIRHGCRRCFNLCDSFPRLFDLVDFVAVRRGRGCRRGDFKRVVDACTLCDMCFMTKCPYVPPHPFDVDFPI